MLITKHFKPISSKPMTEILSPNSDSLTKVLALLKAHQVVALPTETVYGLAALAASTEAVGKIFKIKGRPSFNPIISHYASLDELFKDVEVDERAIKLAESFWPGPLTMILNKNKDSRITDLVCAGLNTAAVRIPRHEFTLELLKQLGEPLAAPSANPSGRLSPSAAQHVADLFEGRLEWIVDGGSCKKGLESTVLDLSSDTPKLLRYGTLTVKEIENVIGKVALAEHDETIKSPGMLLKHYAPKSPLRLNYDFTSSILENEALISFGSIAEALSKTESNYTEADLYSKFRKIVNISPSADLDEAAAKLFAALHDLDSLALSSIAIMKIPDEGVGKAINDRLSRAAKM